MKCPGIVVLLYLVEETDSSFCRRDVLPSLLAENLQDQLTSVPFPLMCKTDFKMTASRNYYSVDLTSTKIRNTEVNLLIGAMGRISDCPAPPQCVQGVTEGMLKENKSGVITGIRCVPTEQNCDLKNLLTRSKSLGSWELSGHLSKASFVWAYWENLFWSVISSGFWS